MKRVLVIGATGTFGSRLCSHLAKMPELHLFVGSRRLERATAAATLIRDAGSAAKVEPVALRVERDLIDVFAVIKPWLVIDASGPFQFSNYDVPRAALDVGAHYLDLADAQGFLLGFERDLDVLARGKGLLARAGCSTTPALTTAVVDAITHQWERVDAVDATIIPGGSNIVGPALAAAVLSQAGIPITEFRHGRYAQVHGWLQARRVTVPRLGTYRAVPAETVDPMIMPGRYGLTSRMTFRAGLVSAVEQRGFEFLALLRRTGVIKRIDRLAPLLAFGRKLTRLWSHDRGGMVIDICGVDAQNRWVQARWSLLAERGHGPHVPILPLVAAVRMLIAGDFSTGARMVQGDIPLARILDEFAGLAISPQLDISFQTVGAFDRALGVAAHLLPPVVRYFHDLSAQPVWHGSASVERGTHLVSRLVAGLIGLPAAGQALPLQVSVERDASGSEVWTRQFAGQSFQSRMSIGSDGSLNEGFGPAQFVLDVQSSTEGTSLPVVSGRLFGVQLPRFLLPRVAATEREDEHGRFQFDVRIELPFFGLLAHYKGWLKPGSQSSVDRIDFQSYRDQHQQFSGEVL
jgi:NAD(P)-dependent dehydrogenase (short-subunit alcohol dehydrogenase family)